MKNNKTYAIASSIFEAPLIEPGLYLVATPIGNLKDITLRALEVLASADKIACEDTRVSRVLLNHYAIKAKLLSYHEHNAQKACETLLKLLKDGAAIALISDAGTPLICDPGFKLVDKAQEAGIKIFSIPGACALLSALTSSGLPTDRFCFMGFLPSKNLARLKRIEESSSISFTLIYYETAQRLLASLEDFIKIYGREHKAAIGRELTKRFENIKQDCLGTLYDFYKQQENIKGEIVLIIGPLSDKKIYDKTMIDQLLKEKLRDFSPSLAAQNVAKITGEKKADLYRRAIEMKHENLKNEL